MSRLIPFMFFLCGFNLHAQTFDADSTKSDTSKVITEDIIKSSEMPQITIVSSRDKPLVGLPGTYQAISTKGLREKDALTVNEVFRKVSGIHTVDEEGIGLRINIGIRGLDPDRSRNVLILEDGIPIALNPYGEPEAYFSPSIDKMSSVEILKGSGQILYGPQTTGGVINFITQDPPDEKLTQMRLRGGSGGFMSLYASHGDTYDKVGFNVSILHKRADLLGSTWFNLTDINAKIKMVFSERSSIGLKFGFYDELSNSTYVGITQSMFEAGNQDFIQVAPDDLLPVRRISASATHKYSIKSNLNLQTTGYAYSTTRNWRRQDFSSNPAASNQSGVIWGNPDIPGSALYMLNSTGNRNRQFEVAGLESRLNWKEDVFGKTNELDFGARFLYERAFEQFIIGAKPIASSGQIRDDEVRTGHAWALFLQDRYHLSNQLSITGGVRLEHYTFERNILRGRFMIDGRNEVRDTSVVGSASTISVIPGIGFNYNISGGIQVFGGVHKGYAPPRVKDAITPQGATQDLDAELSVNTELGFRVSRRQYLQWHFTAFLMNFSNQIIPVSESSGNLNATGLVNGGATRHAGVETNFSLALQELIDMKSNRLEMEVALTYVHSVYSADRFVGNELTNIKGNKLPYAPEWTMWTGISTEFYGVGFNTGIHFIAGQFTDEINSRVASPDGRNGWIDPRFVADAGISYRFKKRQNIIFRLNVKNLSDERYIASRRPQGIRVGLPRIFIGGVDFSF